MLADNGWGDVTVCNISSRGMMLRCDTPPPRNSYVEIRHLSACAVGRVVWSNGSCFGINTQDTIILADLLARASARPRSAGEERRMLPRKVQHSVQMRTLSTEDSSRIFARLFDWAAIALAVAVGAMIVADLAGGAMQRPLQQVHQGLQARNSTTPL